MESRNLVFFPQVKTALDRIESNRPLEDIATMLDTGKKVLVMGNGGSDAIAQHLVIDLLNINIRAATIHRPTLIAAANDFGWENGYEVWLCAMMKLKDVAVIISSSGESENMIKAAEVAGNLGSHIITLTGFKPDNRLRLMGHDQIYVPSRDYGVVEVVHQIILHGMTNYLKEM
jgi:D-sedoheptulose 7-phosphate isomerase